MSRIPMTFDPLQAASRPEPDAAQPSRRPSLASGRGYLGLALLGWGLSILLGVTPHEDQIVGIGLAAFGGALVATAPRLPRLDRASPAIVAGIGLAAAACIV